MRMKLHAILATAVAGAVAGVLAAGAAPAPPFPPLVRLPADQVAHPAYGNEWWYTVGHLYTKGGREFGSEVSLNRLALAPLPGHLYRADLAVADVKAQAFHTDVQVLLSATESPTTLDVRMGTTSLRARRRGTSGCARRFPTAAASTCACARNGR